ncbi:MAG: hypothetical protein RB191_00180 [Terriglobia bacterium]|nr:hypothetical protein [Terriglobia bacterium]
MSKVKNKRLIHKKVIGKASARFPRKAATRNNIKAQDTKRPVRVPETSIFVYEVIEADVFKDRDVETDR